MIIVVAGLWIGFAGPVAASENANGVKIRSATTFNVGMKSTRQRGGAKVTLAISPVVSATCRNRNGARVALGPASVVRSIARNAKARRWREYK